MNAPANVEVKKDAVEIIKISDKGIRIRIYENQFYFFKETGEYKKAINNQWVAYIPTQGIKKIIDERFNTHLSYLRTKASNEIKRQEAMAYYAQFPNHQNKRELTRAHDRTLFANSARASGRY